jgi:hypothetical protein
VFHWVSSGAYRFALDPTPEQDALLRSHCGGQRYAFNWDLALVKANFEQRWAEKSYDIPAAELTPSLNWSAHCLQKLLDPGQGHDRAVVGGELERGVLLWAGEPRYRAEQ